MIRGKPMMVDVLLRAAKACAKARRMPLRAISRLAYGDSGFFARIRRGKALTVDKYDEVMAWLADPANWPNGVVSPEVIDLFAQMKEPAP